MLRALLRLRYLAAVVAVAFVVNAMGFFALGVARTLHAYSVIIESRGLPPPGGERPGIHLGESIDLLLFALVLIVLAIGTTSLFLIRGSDAQPELPVWMRVRSLSELKLVLWEAILATLVVSAATGVIADLPHLEWRHLVLPGVILILSVSYFLVKYIDSKD